MITFVRMKGLSELHALKSYTGVKSNSNLSVIQVNMRANDVETKR